MSWFASLCDKKKVDNVMMAVNTRKRVPGVDANLAGNYIEAPVMRKADLETPATVRACLNRWMVPGNRVNFPTAADFKRYLGGTVTNWTSFYHHVEPEGFRQTLHFPMVIEADADTVSGFSFGSEYDMIVFVPNKGQFGCVIWSRRPNDVNEEKMKSTPLIGDKLMND